MKTLLIPIDFSDVSYTAAQYGLDLADHLNALKVIFYHSYVTTPVALSNSEQSENLYYDAAIKHLEKMTDRLRIPKAISRDKIILLANNHPVKTGVEAIVNQHNVSLIVMGIAGLSDIENTLIGRNTLAVAASGVAPLLIVPRNHVFQTVKKVVYATDLRDIETSTPVDSIKRIAGQLDAETYIVHVDYESQHQSPETLLCQKQLTRLLGELNPVFDMVNEHKDKAYGIFDYVKKHDIDLILMASRNYGFFERLFHNSVSKKLLNIADVPVVLLKNKPVA
ncbi:universal stress protein [Parapedobacter tibetensis]|uniref:universal stress protein n=1 Tax=Parapedobacter tibetensis TaxID=2972951 RepID=UPI00214DD99B|nr:universal stress protein [Parapedobacter tibetensis]